MMIMNTLRYGFIGCGMMGQEHLKNLDKIEDSQVTIIFEPDEVMKKKSAKLMPKACLVESAEAVIKSESVDAIVICSPNHLHASQLNQISLIRPLPVLVEKPVCTSMEQIRSLQQIAKVYPKPVWVAMEYRYMPPIARMIQEIHSGSILGSLKTLSIREHRYPFLSKVGDWNRFNENTGGTLVEKCCHFFDLICFIIQSDPVGIFASGAQDVNHLRECYDGRNPDILDNAFVIVDFASGQRALIELCMFADGSWFQETITAIGTEAKVECQIPGPTRFWPKESLGNPPIAQLTISPRNPKGPETLEIPIDPVLMEAGDHNGSTFYQHERFAKVLRGKQPVEVSLEDGLKAVLMGLAAHRSIETGKKIDLTQGEYQIT